MTVPTANPPSYPLASIVSIKRALNQLFYPGQERPGISNDRFGSRAEDRRIQMGGLHAPRNALDLSVQRRQYFSRGNEVDDWVLGVECVDDGAQARLTRLRAPLTCEN
jgi:hypothetical protein